MSQQNNDTFNLFDGMTDDEIERFLLDCDDTDLAIADESKIVDSSKLTNDLEGLVLHDTKSGGNLFAVSASNTLAPDSVESINDTVTDNTGDQNRALDIELEDLVFKANLETANGNTAINDEISESSSINDTVFIKSSIVEAKEAIKDDLVLDEVSNLDIIFDEDSVKLSLSSSSVGDTLSATDTPTTFNAKISEIEDNMREFQQRLSDIARYSDEFHELSSKLIENVRELQLLDGVDFAITYEQVYQLRGSMLAARRAFNEVPNFYDLVGQAWENDLYTAQIMESQQK